MVFIQAIDTHNSMFGGKKGTAYLWSIKEHQGLGQILQPWDLDDWTMQQDVHNVNTDKMDKWSKIPALGSISMKYDFSFSPFTSLLKSGRLPEFFQFIGLLLHHLHKLRHVLCKLDDYKCKLGHVVCFWHKSWISGKILHPCNYSWFILFIIHYQISNGVGVAGQFCESNSFVHHSVCFINMGQLVYNYEWLWNEDQTQFNG